jgi:hypothetical protein
MAMRPYSRGTNERLALSPLGERVDRIPMHFIGRRAG